MTVGIRAFTLFCDEVLTDDANGKYSVIGCYGNTINVSPMPAMMRKLCANVHIFVPKKIGIDSIKITAVLGKTIIGELDVPQQKYQFNTNEDFNDGSENTIITFMSFSPLFFIRPSSLNIHVKINGKKINAGKLIIKNDSK